MEIIALIPARGGSKGIPFKNIRHLNGKPLIAHSIENAKKANNIDRIVVTTDDKKISAISEECGAEVIIRPKEFSNDQSPSELALLHAIEHMKTTENYFPDLIVFLQCTSPLTLPVDINSTIDILINENADCALSVSPFHHFLWEKTEEDTFIGINHNKNVRELRQNMKLQYLETGSIYVMRTKGFIKSKHRFFGKIAAYIMPKERCIEIDEEIDFHIAETLLKLEDNKNKLELFQNDISALVLDFDGVFTDNRVIVFQNGEEAVICNRGDGMGLEKLKKVNIPILVLSKENSPVVERRCTKLGLDYRKGVDDKLSALKKWLNDTSLTSENVVYLGNDENDIPCLEFVGFPITVKDAHIKAREVSKIILDSNGGYGAIRELCDIITSRK